jgi:KipI family sensor histidine kinase inhibitor
VQYHIEIAAENAFIIYLSQGDQAQATLSPALSEKIQQVAGHLTQAFASYLIDLIPSYRSILIVYDLNKMDPDRFKHALERTLNTPLMSEKRQSNCIQLPVFYHRELALDADRVEQHTNMAFEQIAQMHQQTEYNVLTVGFAPGFAYMGMLDPSIAVPRLDTPRVKVPKGAVAIADQQTAVYPAVSPGGWNIIGLCPTSMFNLDPEPNLTVNVGDRVQFVAINKQEFLALGGQL